MIVYRLLGCLVKSWPENRNRPLLYPHKNGHVYYWVPILYQIEFSQWVILHCSVNCVNFSGSKWTMSAKYQTPPMLLVKMIGTSDMIWHICIEPGESNTFYRATRKCRNCVNLSNLFCSFTLDHWRLTESNLKIYTTLKQVLCKLEHLTLLKLHSSKILTIQQGITRGVSSVGKPCRS